MPRDYKSKGGTGRSKTRKKSGSKASAASPIKLLLAGFSAGVVAAAVAYYVLTPAPPARRDGPAANVVAPRSIAGDEDVPVGAASPPPQAPAPAAKPVAETTQAQDEGKKKYQFWEWLEDYEVILTEDRERVEKTTPVQQVTRAGTYLLQVGAFNRHADAERLKAQLALLGIEARIQLVTIDERKLHRVRIGPESDVPQLNRLRARLAENNIDSIVISVGP